MASDYVEYFEEFGAQVIFTFFMEEKWDTEDIPPEYEYEISVVPNSHLELNCCLKINNTFYNYEDYKKRLAKLAGFTQRYIQHLVFINKDHILILEKISQTIKKCLGVFDIKNSHLVRSNCTYLLYEDPRLPSSRISEKEIFENNSYLNLISPYVKLQYDSIIQFNEKFEKTHGSILVGSKHIKDEDKLFSKSTFYYNEHDPIKRFKSLEKFQNALESGGYIKVRNSTDFSDIFSGAEKEITYPVDWLKGSILIAHFIHALSSHQKITGKCPWKAASNCFTFHNKRKSSTFYKGSWKKDLRPDGADDIATALQIL